MARNARHRMLVSVLLAGALSTAGASAAAASTTEAGPVTAATNAPAGAEGTPPSAEAGTADWVQLSAGLNHTCAIRTSGRLYCWGDDTYDQLGNGADNTPQAAPVEVAGGSTNWASVSAGAYHTCAIKTSGRLFCWGYDGDGEVGNGDTVADTQVPVPVLARSATVLWSRVDAGTGHTCAIRTTGRLFCWGLNGDGQLGDNDPNVDQTAPVPVATGFTDWKSVSAGGSHTCALRTNRHLFCWGDGTNGQVGDDQGVDRPAPSQVYGALADWASVSAGSAHTCAIRTNHLLYCWGNDGFGQLGNGATVTTDVPRPRAVRAPAIERSGEPGPTEDPSWVSVSAGAYQTCGRRISGHLACWGSNTNGQLGNGLPLQGHPSPVEVAGAATSWATPSVGGFHACASRTSGRLFCWGNDANGELGNGAPFADKPAPSQVA